MRLRTLPSRLPFSRRLVIDYQVQLERNELIKLNMRPEMPQLSTLEKLHLS